MFLEGIYSLCGSTLKDFINNSPFYDVQKEVLIIWFSIDETLLFNKSITHWENMQR